jgi:hypothetical protein
MFSVHEAIAPVTESGVLQCQRDDTAQIIFFFPDRALVNAASGAALSQRFIRFLASLCVRVCIFIFNLVCIDQFDLTILKALNSCVAEKAVRDEFIFTSAMNMA